ncbi:endonuclease III [Actinomycetaceae bacterium TAE3-ERU4]|nr:endonuclease III [Actinomycetaceae bacterium TAE3-ERU4]
MKTITNASEILQGLAKLYPDAKCALEHENPYQLLVATVLSAQTTDKRVNTITPELFRRYPNPEMLSQAVPDELESLVRPLGFGARRSKQLLGLAAKLEKEYNGKVPQTRKELKTLPGVGQKTANVVLGNCFNHPAITVDTHVGRLTRRFGWTKETKPDAAERDLEKIIPQPQWTIACHRIIEHGRNVCHSQKPACNTCKIAPYCPQIGV